MNNNNESTKQQLLKGSVNYLTWIKRMKLKLQKEGVLKIENETRVWLKDKTLDGQLIILDNISDHCGHILTGEESPEEMLEKISQTYGPTKDMGMLRSECYTISLPYRISPAKGFDELDKRKELLVSAGGRLEDSEEVNILINCLHENFWFNCRGQLRMKGYCNLTASDVRKEILAYWHAYSNPAKRVFHASASLSSSRKCTNCFKIRPHQKVKSGKYLYETHDTAYCRVNEENKEKFENYSPILLDTCANYHYFSDKPKINYKACLGKVYGPNNSVSEILGTGDVKLQNIVLKDVKHVPSFTKNLVSGPKLTKKGYNIFLSKNKFDILNEDKLVVAHGELNENDLPEFDKTSPIPVAYATQKSDDEWLTLHKKFAHANVQTIKRTLIQLNLPIPKQQMPSQLFCDSCLTTKAKHSNLQNKRPADDAKVLDVLEVDLQILNVLANDGSKINMKVIDRASGYLFLQTLTSKSSEQTSDVIKRIIKFAEQQTSTTVKTIYTDDGTEFQGHFQDYLLSKGIIHKIGNAYEHHIPGKVERANQTIFNWAHAMIKDSKLPISYYNYALQLACYIFNRTIHHLQEKTPYELFFGSSPRMNNLQIFGQCCTAFIVPEKRSSDFADRGASCRFLGYAADKDLIEKSGYILLDEKDGHIFCSNNVRFHSTPMTSLSHLESTSDVNIDPSDLDYVPPPAEDSDFDSNVASLTDDDNVNISGVNITPAAHDNSSPNSEESDTATETESLDPLTDPQIGKRSRSTEIYNTYEQSYEPLSKRPFTVPSLGKRKEVADTDSNNNDDKRFCSRMQYKINLVVNIFYYTLVVNNNSKV